jgi:hypothetical protein
MGPMTDEQSKLAGDNASLALWFSSRNLPPIGMSRDEWQAECLYRLCSAAIYFKDNRGGRFSTYATMSFRSGYSEAMSHRLCRIRDARRDVAIPEDFDWVDGSGNYPGRDMERREARRQVCVLMRCLSGIQLEIVLDRLDGKPFADIARERGVSRQYCKEIHRRAVQRMGREASRLKMDPAI